MIRSASIDPAEVEDAMQIALSNTLDTMSCEVRKAELRAADGQALQVWMMIGEPPWVTALALALVAGWWPDENAPPEQILVAVPAKSLVLIASAPSVDVDDSRVVALEKLAADAYAKSDDDEAIFDGLLLASPDGLEPLRDYGPAPTLDFRGSSMLSLDDLEPSYPADLEQRVSAAVADFIGSGAIGERSDGVGMYLAAAWCGGAHRLCAAETRLIPVRRRLRRRCPDHLGLDDSGGRLRRGRPLQMRRVDSREHAAGIADGRPTTARRSCASSADRGPSGRCDRPRAIAGAGLEQRFMIRCARSPGASATWREAPTRAHRVEPIVGRRRACVAARARQSVAPKR